MKNLNKDSAVYKMLLLGIVCAVCGLLLSGANAVTAPIIEQNKLNTVKSKLEMIYPGGEFEDITDQYIGLDDTGLIDGIYLAKDKGIIFTLHGTGYNSDGFTFIAGFDNDGKISGFKALEQKETDGIGARCFTEGGEYESSLLSLTAADPIPLLSGATLTSTAIQKGMDAAKNVFSGIQGGTVAPSSSSSTPASSVDANSLAGEDFSSAEPYCRAWTNTDPSAVVYKCSAKGYEGRNEATITVNENEGKVVSVEVTAFNDTEGVGDAAVTEAELKRYAGATTESVIDATSGASLTSKSLRAMTAAALGIEPKAAGAETPAAAEETPAAEASCRAWSNTDPKAYVYKCSAQGFEGRNEATVTVNKEEGKVVSIEVTAFNDTEGVGDAAITEAELKRYAGMTADTTVDATSGASLTSASLRAMALTALNAAAGN